MAAAAERQVQYHRRRRFASRHGRSTGWPSAHPQRPGSDAFCRRTGITGPRLEEIARNWLEEREEEEEEEGVYSYQFIRTDIFSRGIKVMRTQQSASVL